MEPVEVLREIGQVFEDDSVRRGAIVAGGGTLAVLAGLWRWIRGRKPVDDRVRVSVDAPAGKSVRVRLGDDE